MSQVANQCVYNQIQRLSLTSQKPRQLVEQLSIFLATRLFDVALTMAAAMAAVAAGAHAVGAPLTSSMMETAVVAGGIKSAAMAIAGLLVLAPVNAAFIFLPALFAISIGTNVLLVAVIADRVLGEMPTALLGAAAVASIPLSFCLIYYYGGFLVPITFISIAIDVLGAYTFARMAENLGYPICSGTTAATAAAAFSAVSSFGATLIGCCFIGRSRTRNVFQTTAGGTTSATTRVGCCGRRNFIFANTRESFNRSDGFNVTQGTSTRNTSGTVHVSFHGLGLLWDAGIPNGFCGVSKSDYRDNTTTNETSNSRTFGFG